MTKILKKTICSKKYIAQQMETKLGDLILSEYEFYKNVTHPLICHAIFVQKLFEFLKICKFLKKKNLKIA